jgi:hypothetical protein
MLMSHFENNWSSDLDEWCVWRNNWSSACELCLLRDLVSRENNVCNSIISVFQLVDPGVLFELVKGMEIKSQMYTIMYSFS